MPDIRQTQGFAPEPVISLLYAFIGIAACEQFESEPQLEWGEGQNTSITINSTGGSKTLCFTINNSWSAESSESWLHISPSSGDAGEQEITLSAQANTEYRDREAVVSISFGGQPQKIQVLQEEKKDFILNTTDFLVGSEGGTIEIPITTNIYYSVAVDESCSSWISVADTPTKALKDYTVMLSVMENTGESERVGQVKISGAGKESVITITQEAVEAEVEEENCITLVYVTENNNEDVCFAEGQVYTQGYGSSPRTNIRIYYNDGTHTFWEMSNYFEVDCGDGNTTDGSSRHTYKYAGEYTVKFKFSSSTEITGISMSGECMNWIKSISLPSTIKRVQIDGGEKLEEIHIESSALDKERNSYINGENIWRFSGPMASEDGKFLVSEGEVVAYAPAGQLSFSIPEDVQFPSNATKLGTELFSGYSITSAEIPEGISEIGEGAFMDNKSLKTITFPSTLKKVAYRAFYRCSLVEEFVFAEGLESIGEQAFYGCTTVENMYLPNSVTDFGDSALSGCESLKTLHLPDALEVIPERSFMYCYDLTTVNIPASIKEIGKYAFKDCTLNGELIFPESLEYIGDYAFSGENQKISKVYLGEKLYYVGNYAFATNENLKTVEFNPETKLDRIENSVFAGSGIESISVPKNIKYISKASFHELESLCRVDFAAGSKLISIEDGNGYYGAFMGCTNLSEISLPSGLQSIGAYAFYSCNLSKIDIPSSVQNIGTKAFCGNNLSTIALPSSLESLSADFVDENSNLSSYSSASPNFIVSSDGLCLANSEGELMRFVFTGYPSEYAIPGTIGSTTITSLGYGAFYGRTFSSITLPETVSDIKQYGLNGTIDKIYCTNATPPTLHWTSGVDWDGAMVGSSTMVSLNYKHSTAYVPIEYYDAYYDSDWAKCTIVPVGDNPDLTVEPVEEMLSFSVNGIDFNMIGVEGGTFWMGAHNDPSKPGYDPTSTYAQDNSSNPDGPAHQVSLSSYYIAQTEVTQALWYAVMGEIEGDTHGDNWDSKVGLGANYPAYFVSWDDAQEFVSKLNELTGVSFSLPTEAQWEYAARGGNKSEGYSYSGSNDPDEVGWYESYSSRNPQCIPVASLVPNELGIYDMSGNMEEWCSDYDGKYGYALVTNPTGPEDGARRILRGGRSGRVAARGDALPDYEYEWCGLRLALTDLNATSTATTGKNTPSEEIETFSYTERSSVWSE